MIEKRSFSVIGLKGRAVVGEQMSESSALSEEGNVFLMVLIFSEKYLEKTVAE